MTATQSGPALALGGHGGVIPDHVGGADSATGTGGAGVTTAGHSANGGGGGGAGATGGDGAYGGTSTPGGAGGSTAGASGGAGTGSSTSGGSGGGGGAHGVVAAARPLVEVTGGNGGGGGSTTHDVGQGGGGGAGGWGAVVTGSGELLNLVTTVTGGNGGAGGNGMVGGGGGSGGHGLALTGSSPSIGISAAVTGGNGGAAGVGEWDQAGAAGAGGVGIIGTGMFIALNSTVTGGLGGDGVTRANAISFLGSTNTLVLGSTAGVTGNLDIAAGGTLSILVNYDPVLETSITGGGTFVKLGTGALTLTGDVSVTGGVGISAGTLQIGNGGSTGSLEGSSSILNNGGLIYNRTGTTTTTGVISGSGSVTIKGGGTVILTGANNYSAGTTIESGSTLQLGNGGATGSVIGTIVNNGSLVVNRNNTINLGNTLSGTGSLTIDGTTIAWLTGANTLSGTVTIAAGATASVGINSTSGSFGTGNVVNNGAIEFNRSDTVIIPNAISGSGGATLKRGVVILTGENTYTGATTIESIAALQVGNGGDTGSLGTGNLSNEGSLTFYRTGQITYGGVISGTGAVIQSGPGEVILTGTSTYTGQTLIAGGTLTVNGSIGNSALVSVGAEATLSGSGTVGNALVLPGGVIRPSGTGTLTVNGNLTMSEGSTAAFAVDATGAGRLNVLGTADLQGQVRLIPSGTTFNSPYTLVSAPAITGAPTLSPEGLTGAGLTATLSQTTTAVSVTLTAAPLVPTPPGPDAPPPPPPPGPSVSGPGLVGFLPSNLRNAGLALDAVRKAGADLQPFFGVYNAPANLIGNAVNQLTGEVSTASGAMGQVAGQQFLTSMLSMFGQGQGASMGNRIAATDSADGDDEVAAPRPRYAMWGQAMGGYSRIEGESGVGSASRATRGFGFSMGLDVSLGSESMVGIAVGAGETNAVLAGGLGTSRAWTGQFGAYGRTRLGTPIGGLTLEGGAALSLLDVESKRTQYFLGNAQQRADYDARVYSFRVEGRHDGATRGGIRMQPFLAVQAQVVDSDGFTERSNAPGASTGLRVGSSTNSTVRTELGAQAETRGQVSGRPVRGFARLAWAHYLMREQASSASFVSLPGSGFTTIGARPDADSALMTVGLEAELAPRWTLGGRLDSELSSRVREISGTVRLRYSF